MKLSLSAKRLYEADKSTLCPNCGYKSCKFDGAHINIVKILIFLSLFCIFICRFSLRCKNNRFAIRTHVTMHPIRDVCCGYISRLQSLIKPMFNLTETFFSLTSSCAANFFTKMKVICASTISHIQIHDRTTGTPSSVLLNFNNIMKQAPQVPCEIGGYVLVIKLQFLLKCF